MPEERGLEVLSSPRGPRGEARVAAVRAAARRRPWALAAVAMLVGGAAGAAAAHHLGRRTAVAPPASPGPVLVVSLGPYAGSAPVREGGRSVVSVPLAVENATARPLTVVAVRVTGPGAAVTSDPSGRESGQLPTTLPPGQYTDVSFGLASECSVPLRPLPQVGLVVADAAGRVHVVPVTVPDLAQLWGETLLPGSCPPGA